MRTDWSVCALVVDAVGESLKSAVRSSEGIFFNVLVLSVYLHVFP